MPIVNFGSLNIDDVYSVARIARPGETVAASAYTLFPGGKGMNQSVALGRAGAPAAHVGKVGTDGLWLLDLLQKAGVDTRGVLKSAGPTGRAIIQVDARGENAIVLFPGANRELTEDEIAAALGTCGPGDWVLTQNETSGVPFLLARAASRGLKTIFNPAPFGPEVLDYPLEGVSLLVVNQSEAEALAGRRGPPERLAGALVRRYSGTEVVLTLAADGVLFHSASETFRIPGLAVEAVDTTGAGDTFLGFYLAARQRGWENRRALEAANRAAALSVTRPGAASSIPSWDEVVSPPDQTRPG